LREEIAQLMALQSIDRQLQELGQSLSSVAGRVEQLRGEIETSQAELEQLSEEDKQAAAARRVLERELADGEAQIRNKRMRLNLVRNDKELQALGHEVETLKENNQRLEGEVLASMQAAEPRGPRIKELTELIEGKRAELKAAEKEIAAEVEDLKLSIQRQRVERDRAAALVENALLQRYEMIFSRRGGLAVAVARAGTCQGCRMRLPPQLYNEVQKHLQIHFCPNCQRILYYEG
jgi:predicted  nucleic acid-binding Zn-ribbon protein